MDLHQFTAQLENDDQLHRIKVPVSPDLEIAALCRREFAKLGGGKALLFEQVEGFAQPLVANLFGSNARLAALLRSSSLADYSSKLKRHLHACQGSAVDRLHQFCGTSNLTRCKTAPGDFTVHADLLQLPTIRSWPGESGRYLTLALALTAHPETGRENLGLYRAQIQGQNRLAINFSPGSGAAEHFAICEKRGEPLPICLFLGSDPALIWAAAAPLPRDCSEFAFCQTLFNSDFQFSSCLTQPLQAPANAEFILEGEILPGIRCVEGPFGNHTGRYVRRKDCPVMQVTSIRQRVNALLPVTVVGPPPSENIYLAKANQCLIREMLKIDFPQIIDLQMPLETIFHGAALLSVQSQSSRQIRELIEQLWQHSPLSRSRLLVLLDEDIDLSSYNACWWRTINQLSAERIYQEGDRVAIDATGVDLTQLIVEDQQTADLLRRRSADYNL